MSQHAESNACRACARSKRKCGREMPSCSRCVDRGKSCIYPPTRSKVASSPRSLLSNASRGSVPRVEDGLLADGAGNISSHSVNLSLADDFTLHPAFPLMDIDFSPPSTIIQMPNTRAPGADWFLSPETWKVIANPNNSLSIGATSVTIKKYIALLQSWFERWVSIGSNPFIHHRLYNANFPVCVQVAYATLTSYIHRTPANTDTVLQMVENRSNELLQQNGAILENVDAETWADRGEQDVDLFTQLTRLHSLMVYQIIGLFDGDIRSRHVAEGHIDVQNSWARKLFDSGGNALSSANAAATQLLDCLPRPSTYSQQQWHLWILLESVRRTWLIAASMSPVYSALQRRWAPCPGGIMYTNRGGLWDAPSAPEWEKQCTRGSAAFLQRFECSTLFEDAEPEDIDEFGLALMDMTFKGDLLENWRNGSHLRTSLNEIYAMV